MGVTPGDRTTEQQAADTDAAAAGSTADANGGRADATAPAGRPSGWIAADAISRAATRERDVPWWASGEDGAESQPIDPAQALAAFYDRRAPAALAYCSRVCEPEKIADAVEEAFGRVFEKAAMSAERLSDDELDRLLRDGVRVAAAERAAPARGKRQAERRAREAERAYEALCGDDAPALGRSLLGEMIDAEPFAWPEQSRTAAPRSTGSSPAATPDRTAPPDRAAEAAAPGRAAATSPTPDLLAAFATPASEAPARRRLHLPHISPGWRRRLVIVMAVMGTLLLAEAAVTLAWKEPFTAYLAAQSQDDLDKQLDKLDKTPVSFAESERRVLAKIRSADARERKRMAILAGHLDESVPEGQALGRIQIARMGIDFVFVQGTDGASLRKGPGHYDQGRTVLPGQTGVVGIAGHRTTYEAPFRELDSLRTGDTIKLRMPYGVFTYEVTGHRIVQADFGGAFTTDEAGTGQRLVLSACHPLYSSEQRILVDSKLVSAEPLGSAIETTAPPEPGPSAREIARQRTERRLEKLGDRQLVEGMTGSDVREVQYLLGMPITGTYDANTTAAVLAFQRDHELPQIGSVGPDTKRALARQPHLPTTPPTPADVPQQQLGPTGTQGQQPSNGYQGGSYQGGGYTQPTP